MTSEPASVTSHLQEPDRGEPLEAAKIPLKHKGLDVASQMQSVSRAESDLARTVGNCSTSVEQTLDVIEAIEATLQHKRRQIEEIQARQEILALEYWQLGRSLDTATKDLAQQFTDIITNLETDKPIAKPPADVAPKTSEMDDTSAASAEAPADCAPGNVDASAESPAGSMPETGDASGLNLEASDLPPVPEFLGDRDNPPDHTDDSASRDAGSGSRGWWKHGKKG